MRRFLHSWVAALQLALVGFTLLALLGLLPLLYFLGHWYLVQQSPAGGVGVPPAQPEQALVLPPA